MAKRTEYSYSVISYIPNYTRGESFNIGVIVFGENNEVLDYSLLPIETKKLNSILLETDDRNLFKDTLKLLDFILNNEKNSLSVDVNIMRNIVSIDGIPDTIRLSPLVSGRTTNIPLVLDNLISTYVGDEFFGQVHHTKSQAKIFVKEYFKSNNFIDKNLVSKATFKPMENSPFRYTADYAYFNTSKKLSVISSLPSTEESLDKWYQKNSLLSLKFKNYGNIVYLYDENNFAVEKKQILDDLCTMTNQIVIYNISEQLGSFKDFSKKVLSHSDKKSVDKFIKSKKLA